MVDPVTTEVIRNKLVVVCEEMRISATRTAYGYSIGEILDFSCGLFDADANLVAETSGLPIFLANLSDAIQATYTTLGRENIEEGDIIFLNNPYNGGGSHIPDLTVLAPIFYKGSIVGWSAFRGHSEPSIGGNDPGGWYSDTTEIWQEGVIFSPVKIYSRGNAVGDMLRVIRENSRDGDMLIGDIRAMVSAVRTGSDRFLKIVEKYSLSTTLGSIAAILDNGEKVTRNAIGRIAEGTYRAEVVLDQDGNDDNILDEAVLLRLRIDVKDGEMRFDFTGSNPQLRGPMNIPKPGTISAAKYGFKCVTTPTLPNNQGCFRPLEIVIPAGSFLDPRYPAAVALWPAPATSIPEMIIRALSEAIPDKVWAGHFGDSFSTMVFGLNPKNNKWFISGWANAGGYGATSSWDGNNALHAMTLGDTYNLPIERHEYKYPLRYERFGFLTDSGGPGKLRGGLGTLKDVTVLTDLALISTGDRCRYTPAWGLFGGQRGTPHGQPNITAVFRTDGKEEIWHKVTNLKLRKGDVFSPRPGGGGGYGDPLERDPALVERDVINDYVSVENATTDYGVVLDPLTLKVDLEATRATRERMDAASRSPPGKTEASRG